MLDGINGKNMCSKTSPYKNYVELAQALGVSVKQYLKMSQKDIQDLAEKKGINLNDYGLENKGQMKLLTHGNNSIFGSIGEPIIGAKIPGAKIINTVPINKNEQRSIHITTNLINFYKVNTDSE